MDDDGHFHAICERLLAPRQPDLSARIRNAQQSLSARITIGCTTTAAICWGSAAAFAGFDKSRWNLRKARRVATYADLMFCTFSDGRPSAGRISRRYEVVPGPALQEQRRWNAGFRWNAPFTGPLQLEISRGTVRLRQLAFPGGPWQLGQAGWAKRRSQRRGQLSCVDASRAYADLRRS